MALARAIDTEYALEDGIPKPFLGQTATEALQVDIFHLDDSKERQRIAKICTDPHIVKVFHQESSDRTVLANIDINVVQPTADTMIMASLVNEHFARAGLKALSAQYLGDTNEETFSLRRAASKYKRLAKKEDREFTWRDIPKDVLLPYAKQDPHKTIRLYKILWPIVKEKYLQLYEFEHSLVPIIVKMQRQGLLIDRSYTKTMYDHYANKMVELMASMKAYLEANNIDASEFKPNSSKQLRLILFEYFEFPMLALTAKKEKSTTADVLTQYANMIDNPHTSFVKMLMEYRFYNKQNSTYYGPLLKRYTTSKQQYAFFMFYQSGARTGRFTAELIQTFPRPEEAKRIGGIPHQVRRVVIPGKGKIIVCIDAKQIETRLFAHFSNSTRMIRDFRTGIDPYVAVATNMFGKHLMNASKIMFKGLRWVGKKIVLAFIYGMGQQKLLLIMMSELPNIMDEASIKILDVNASRAAGWIQVFHSIYPARQYMQQEISELYKLGYLRIDIESPIMSVHREYRIPQDLAYKVVNTRIQGTAAYVLKHMMKRVDTLLTKKKRAFADTIMRACVHDELIFTMDADKFASEKVLELKRVMEDTITFKVPILCDAKASLKSWADVKEWDGTGDILGVAV